VTFLSSQRCEASTYQSEAQDVCPTCPQEAFELGANQSKTIQAFQAASCAHRYFRLMLSYRVRRGYKYWTLRPWRSFHLKHV
jgi:hypothetical protein